VGQKETTAGLQVTSNKTGRTASENLKTRIRNVTWFASNGIMCTRLSKVQYYEILWRVLTVVSAFSVLKGHCMYRQFNIEQFYVLPTQCIYVFCVDLRTNSDYFPIQH
jgi:hypothetical protein